MMESIEVGEHVKVEGLMREREDRFVSFHPGLQCHMNGHKRGETYESNGNE
jgi:hypothetical protein